ncbi:beta-ketoacyl synthase N-terminal-like domain-containing protein [Catellatospora sp. KI3]|uniref:beta-ketoacyl-[acyl-carrier-protein] synthase family protein n=1 Tax=Catellatospora sp. KI3 TaxID=3041620 RepID=UPI00248285AE|nr:beta-ketoacyl synthase N-terminal-like domain-containing protein [Catellatospora sp. KI3]MDI1461273.1 beta-ketoacyl synthase N-terminal-like domain-containing protein [Catellatospora sp. KI3]
MTTPSASHSPSRHAVVTGMGFCLPGLDRPVLTGDDLWQVAATGRTCLRQQGVYYGSVGLPPTMFTDLVPWVPDHFARHFTDAHRYGLIAMAQACADAGLDPAAGDLVEAAVLAGRGGVDTTIERYLAVLRADPATATPHDAMNLFIGGELGVTLSDLALVQSAVARSTGPCHTVSCGCASSAVQIGHAQSMIERGEADVAVVTGVDVFNIDLIRRTQSLLNAVRDADEHPDGLPALTPAFDRLMRPYDRRADCVNYGEGAATVILESREHAAARGAAPYGRVVAQATTRDGLAHPLTSDDSGAGLVAAVRRCLARHCDIREVGYVHGGSDGDALVTAFEANAVRELYGDAVGGLLMTSQEACFGHNGAPAGALGVALTLLMLRHGQACPTANCEQPDPAIPFDPVPGTAARPLRTAYALSLNYQVGGVKSAILLSQPDLR